jgi:hypothetical protein
MQFNMINNGQEESCGKKKQLSMHSMINTMSEEALNIMISIPNSKFYFLSDSDESQSRVSGKDNIIDYTREVVRC